MPTLHASFQDKKEYVYLIWQDFRDTFASCGLDTRIFFIFFEKSQSILALLFSGGNLGPGK